MDLIVFLRQSSFLGRGLAEHVLYRAVRAVARAASVGFDARRPQEDRFCRSILQIAYPRQVANFVRETGDKCSLGCVLGCV